MKITGTILEVGHETDLNTRVNYITIKIKAGRKKKDLKEMEKRISKHSKLIGRKARLFVD